MTTLAEQVRAALKSPGSSQDAAALLAKVIVAAADARTRAEVLRATASDPLATDKDASQARVDLERLHFDLTRLSGQEEAMAARVDELREAEQQALAQAAFEAVRDRRDALAAEIRERYPKLAAELAHLLSRLDESDAEVVRHRIESAEAVARSCPGNFYLSGAPVHRLTTITLPALDAGASSSRALRVGSR